LLKLEGVGALAATAMAAAIGDAKLFKNGREMAALSAWYPNNIPQVGSHSYWVSVNGATVIYGVD